VNTKRYEKGKLKKKTVAACPGNASGLEGLELAPAPYLAPAVLADDIARDLLHAFCALLA
jgi:hypothetical protein